MVEIPQIFEVGEKTYSLCGIINHKGELSYGHYTCFAKNDNDEWFYFNDNEVRKVQANEINTAENYIIFFKLKKN